MSSISLRTKLASIGVSMPFSFLNSLQASPKSLKAALRATNSPDIANWKYLFHEEFANTGWSEELQGVAHDDQHWYFSHKSGIVKLTKQYQKIAETGIPSSFTQRGYHHFGDCDFNNGYLYIPLEHCSYITPPLILVYNANLTWTGFGTLSGQRHAPWCAVDPWNGNLYTSEDNNVSKLFVYDLGLTGLTFKHIGDFTLYNSSGQVESLNQVQGGCFSKIGHLYLTSGASDDIRCYCLLNGRFMGRKEISYSKGSPEYEEMEGITIWDLSSDGKGQIHLAILDNDYPSEDDLFLKHFACNKPGVI